MEQATRAELTKIRDLLTLFAVQKAGELPMTMSKDPWWGVFLELETESGERMACSSKLQASGLHWATHRAFAEMTIVDQDRKVFVPRGIGGAAPRRGAV
jgi:hypothetical protein